MTSRNLRRPRPSTVRPAFIREQSELIDQVSFYQGAKEHPATALGPRMWRLKQDRPKPAPHSDFVHFALPAWPKSSADDVLLCSEVKTKSTKGTFSLIKSAISDGANDGTSRLAPTERALSESLGDVQVARLGRFINTTEHPPATKRFRAVAVDAAASPTASGGQET